MTIKNGIKPQYTCERCEKQTPVIVHTVVKTENGTQRLAVCKDCFMEENNG